MLPLKFRKSNLGQSYGSTNIPPNMLLQKINFSVIQPIYFKFCTLITLYELTTKLPLKFKNSNLGQSHVGTNIHPNILPQKVNFFVIQPIYFKFCTLITLY